ncbi:hypothetical protein BDQ17DRAFT_335400 [Cyathus striatus]|nr:hypothetical protein BDQ17DRAFT_335400 [Cyathus striatus]
MLAISQNSRTARGSRSHIVWLLSTASTCLGYSGTWRTNSTRNGRRCYFRVPVILAIAMFKFHCCEMLLPPTYILLRRRTLNGVCRHNVIVIVEETDSVIGKSRTTAMTSSSCISGIRHSERNTLR